MKKRPICHITIIFILVIWGLYNFSIALFEYNDKKEGKFQATIESIQAEKEYTDSYIIKMNRDKFILYTKKNKSKFQIGDTIEFSGKYYKPSNARNYGGFDYSLYLKTKKIKGIFNTTEVTLIHKNKRIKYKYKQIIENLRTKIERNAKEKMQKENASILIGILIGEKSNINQNEIENFRNAGISHILAISGAHFSYIILVMHLINKKIKNKKAGQLIMLCMILFFMQLTQNTPSVVRTGIMNILIIIASMTHNKSDFWNNLAISLIIQIINNPYVIFDIGLILSYSGVIGIVTLYNKIQKIIKFKILSVTLSANIVIIPIMIYNFGTISLSFIMSNFFVSVLLGPIIILGFIASIINIKIIYKILEILIIILRKITVFFGNIPGSKIYLPSINLFSIILFYICIILILNKPKINQFKVKNKAIKFKNILIPIMIIILLLNLNWTQIAININGNLLINFIDLNQGDSTLIRIKNKVILIDGGGNSDLNGKNDIGKNTLLPYLLKRKITKIDYIIISHFDTDHVGGILTIIKELKVNTVIISNQKEENDNYKKFKEIVKNKKINIMNVKMGAKLRIEKDLYFDIIWPNEGELISENVLNNNSIVAMLRYKNFSMLFTGDIEEIAERKILKEYKNNLKVLKAIVLKVAHHGSKTSSIQEFIDVVKPKIVLIGVGEDNKFGHPNDEVIERFKNIKSEIYRTDEMGEISIEINKKGKIKINKQIIKKYY